MGGAGSTLLAVIALACAAAGAAPAQAISSDPPRPHVLAFDRFVTASGPVCEHQAARACVELGFAFADTDGDEHLSLAELELVRDQLQAWSAWREDEIAAFELRSIALGLWLVNSLGLDTLHTLYDADDDGRLSRAELLADVELDERPLGEVLLDPEAVDRKAVARRLGALAPLLDQALP